MVVGQLMRRDMLTQEMENQPQVALEPGIGFDIPAEEDIQFSMTCPIPEPWTKSKQEQVTEQVLINQSIDQSVSHSVRN